MARATSTWWVSPTVSSCSAAGPRWLADRAVQLRVRRSALERSWTFQERFDETWILALLAGRAGGRSAVAGRDGWSAVPPVRAGLVQYDRLVPAGPAPRAFSLAAGLPRRDPGQGGGRAGRRPFRADLRPGAAGAGERHQPAAAVGGAVAGRRIAAYRRTARPHWSGSHRIHRTRAVRDRRRARPAPGRGAPRRRRPGVRRRRRAAAFAGHRPERQQRPGRSGLRSVERDAAGGQGTKPGAYLRHPRL